MRPCYTAAALAALLLISGTAKANEPDPKTLQDLAALLLDLGQSHNAQALIDLNQVELDWLTYRSKNNDTSPHAPVAADTLFNATALVLGDLGRNDYVSAITHTQGAVVYVQKGPPPYTKPTLHQIKAFCVAVQKLYQPSPDSEQFIPTAQHH